MRAFLIAVFALAACAQAGGAPAPTVPEPSPNAGLAQQIRADNERLDRELSADGVFAAGIGETATLGGGLTVRPIEVIEDSRCPMNVDCIWAGRLRLRADVSGATRELTLREPLVTPQGTVTLAVAKPSPFHEWPSEQPRPAYRFGFRRG